jgi:hypothetical protein
LRGWGSTPPSGQRRLGRRRSRASCSNWTSETRLYQRPLPLPGLPRRVAALPVPPTTVVGRCRRAALSSPLGWPGLQKVAHGHRRPRLLGDDVKHRGTAAQARSLRQASAARHAQHESLALDERIGADVAEHDKVAVRSVSAAEADGRLVDDQRRWGRAAAVVSGTLAARRTPNLAIERGTRLSRLSNEPRRIGVEDPASAACGLHVRRGRRRPLRTGRGGATSSV